MSQVEWKSFNLPNIPLYDTHLPETVIDRLWEYANDASELMNQGLAGNISESFVLSDKANYLLEFLRPVAERYSTETLTWSEREALGNELKLRNLWINYQNKHEFNPGHNHTGTLSFVIWLKIPIEGDDQHNLPISRNSNCPSASDFEFVYTDILGNIRDYHIKMGKDKEGIILVFPARLRHQVYPFYECNEKRVSISGNLEWI